MQGLGLGSCLEQGHPGAKKRRCEVGNSTAAAYHQLSSCVFAEQPFGAPRRLCLLVPLVRHPLALRVAQQHSRGAARMYTDPYNRRVLPAAAMPVETLNSPAPAFFVRLVRCACTVGASDETPPSPTDGCSFFRVVFLGCAASGPASEVTGAATTTDTESEQMFLLSSFGHAMTINCAPIDVSSAPHCCAPTQVDNFRT